MTATMTTNKLAGKISDCDDSTTITTSTNNDSRNAATSSTATQVHPAEVVFLSRFVVILGFLVITLV